MRPGPPNANFRGRQNDLKFSPSLEIHGAQIFPSLDFVGDLENFAIRSLPKIYYKLLTE